MGTHGEQHALTWKFLSENSWILLYSSVFAIRSRPVEVGGSVSSLGRFQSVRRLQSCIDI